MPGSGLAAPNHVTSKQRFLICEGRSGPNRARGRILRHLAPVCPGVTVSVHGAVRRATGPNLACAATARLGYRMALPRPLPAPRPQPRLGWAIGRRYPDRFQHRARSHDSVRLSDGVYPDCFQHRARSHGSVGLSDGVTPPAAVCAATVRQGYWKASPSAHTCGRAATAQCGCHGRRWNATPARTAQPCTAVTCRGHHLGQGQG
jgi:hypothetical protein